MDVLDIFFATGAIGKWLAHNFCSDRHLARSQNRLVLQCFQIALVFELKYVLYSSRFSLLVCILFFSQYLDASLMNLSQHQIVVHCCFFQKMRKADCLHFSTLV